MAIDQQRFVTVLRGFAGTLTGQFRLFEVLDRLADNVRAIVDVTGAGVMLADDNGDLRFTSSDDPVLSELEALQISLDEGPCLLAFRTGEEVIASDLSDDRRFPEFGPRAVEAGMQSVFSFPMRWEHETVGALNFYRSDASELGDDQVEAARTLADIATAYLLHSRADDRVHALADQLQGALDSRVVIEQAKGYIAARLDVEPDVAFNLLRGFARSRSIRLGSVADDVVRGDLRVTELVGTS